MVRRYILCYDIADAKRLRLVAKLVENYGERLQYSVFICDLNKRALNRLVYELCKIISKEMDSVVIVDLGSARNSNSYFAYSLGSYKLKNYSTWHIV